MKKLCILTATLFLVLTFAASALATISADIDDVVSMIESSSKNSFDYCNVIYNQSDNLLILDLGVDGFAQFIVAARNAGWTEYTDDWVIFKDSMADLYNSTLEFLSNVGREDLKDSLVLRLVNDDVVLRCDYSTISYSPLLIIRKGILTKDVMAR